MIVGTSPVQTTPEGTVSRPLRPFLSLCAATLLVFSAARSAVWAQGVALSGVGPINRAMGGASTAAPLDAAGAIHWNSAAIAGLPSSEVEFGLELMLPSEQLSSTIGPFSGSTGGEPGVTPIPMMAWVYRPTDSPWTYGLGMFGIAGFQVNYPANALATPQSNPILSPQPPNGIGLGRVYSEAQYLQIVPTLSYSLTEKLSIGFAPTLDMAKLAVDPLVFAAPNDANGDGSPSYPPGTGTRYSWGAGFQVGVYYVANDDWQLGFSFSSPQWFEPIRVNTTDELGLPLLEKVHFNYPMVLSLGTCYRGLENWVLACDVRYFDYKDTAGYGDPAALDASGRVMGLGWRSIFSVHAGAQYQATRRLALRAGYQYNDSPIGTNESFFNVASPLIIEHVASVGMSYCLADNLLVSLAYLHGFENQSSGPWPLPIPGTSVTSKISADALGMGLTMRY
jgi:long-chain fatty acid transport protein